MNVVIYARYPSHNQREESIEGQLRKCNEYARRNDMTVTAEYIDRAISGKTDKRPEFQRMMHDAEKSCFQGIIMYTMDRFARNRYDSAIYKSKLRKHGIKCYYTEQSISNEPEGIILESVLEGMAEYYSENLSRGVKRGMKENALQCKITGGYMPLGYRRSADKKYEIDPNTAPIVKSIFEMYSDGNTLKQIVEYLNSNGHRTAKGNTFSISSLQTILHNERYKGKYLFDDVAVENGVPAIIDKELFDRVHAELIKNKRCTGRMKAHEEYLLTTKIFCGHCGEPMTGESGTSMTKAIYNYYKCCGRRKKNGCAKHTERKNQIEKLVVAKTAELLMNENRINEITYRMSDIMKKEYEDKTHINQLENNLQEIQKSIKNLIKLAEKGYDTKDTGERIIELDKTKEELIKLISIEKNKPTPLTKEHLQYWLKGFLTYGSVNDIKYQRKIIDTLINSIFVYDTEDDGRDIIITYNISKNNKYKLHVTDIS